MIPDIRVERLPVRAEPSSRTSDDLVFRQCDRMKTEPRRTDEIMYPGIWFNAFHPDVVYLIGAWGTVPPPLGSDHSSLVLYAWHRGMSVAQTVKLFAEPIFEKLKFFDCWALSKRALLDEAQYFGFSLDTMFARLERVCFMHSPIHPGLAVMAELARQLVQRTGLRPAVASPELYLEDPLLRGAVWPIYPEIGRRLGLPGAYAFKPEHAPNSAPLLLDLEEFIARSFQAYAAAPPATLTCRRLESPAYRELEAVAAGERTGSRDGVATTATAAPRPAEGSPYADLPPSRFWRRAVERTPSNEIDPVGTPPFRIDRDVRIATAGSCFAQNMSRMLVREGFNYFVAEPAPAGLSPDQARSAGYGVFSTRCGNVYTARQLLQLFDRAYGTFEPRDLAWLRPDGRYADPFRPQIEPDGFASADDVVAARQQHLAAVRRMFEELDLLIFTLGLTEAWRSTADGAVFPLAPGVSAGHMDFTRYEFVNFTAADVRADLDAFLARLKAVNPRAGVVLTVSPQPPIATYEPRHVMVSAAYTKAALRVAADEIERAWPNVWYFPGYELVTSPFNRGAYFQDDFRTVTPQGLEHVMRLFFARSAAASSSLPAADAPADHIFNDVDVECDEEAIAYGVSVPSPSRRDHGLPHPEWADYAWARDFFDLPDAVTQQTVPGMPVMEALEHASMRAPLHAVLPSEIRSRTTITIPCRLRNDGDAALASGGRHPVFLCYRWFDERGNLTEVGHSIHTPLPGVVAPGDAVSLQIRIATPRYDGRYRLRVALLQSEVAWFDDVDPENGIEATIDVTARSAAVV